MLQNSEEHRHKLNGTLMSCLAVAPPAVVTRDLAIGCSEYITSLVCQVSSRLGCVNLLHNAHASCPHPGFDTTALISVLLFFERHHGHAQKWHDIWQP